MEQIIQNATQYISIALLIIGVLAFIVSAIVQVIKSLPGLAKIPTNLVVFALAIILSVIALFIYADIMTIVILWYYIVAAVILGFFVAYIAMFGWREFNDLKNRMIKEREDIDEERN